VVIDNGSDDQPEAWLPIWYAPTLVIRRLRENVGVAAAQNAGIREARTLGAEYVLLMDQDSEATPGMVSCLLRGVVALASRGIRVAAVGPRFSDIRRRGGEPFVETSGTRRRYRKCRSADDVVPVDHVISSGCLIPVCALDAVGEMREELFIDYVDIEWCLRARSLGLGSFGICGAELKHQIGDSHITWFSKDLPIHTPLRHYYQVRNAIWMMRQPWIDWGWKLRELYTLVMKYWFLSTFAAPRFVRWYLMTIGVLHAIAGRTGRYQSSTRRQ
jgi:rhamnosyltransferase